MTDDKKTFRFQVNGRTANAHSIGRDHVGLAMSAEGLAFSVVMTVAEANAVCAALTKAVEVSVAMHPDDGDPALPAEDGR